MSYNILLFIIVKLFSPVVNLALNYEAIAFEAVILTQYRLCRVLYSLHKKGDNRVLYF